MKTSEMTGTTLLLTAIRSSESDSENTLYRKVFWRFVPLLMVCFMVAYLDRVNVGFAKLQMLQELKFSEAMYGLGAGIFFIGYFIFEIPSNLILHRYGARRWIARVMLTWGVLAAAMMFVNSPTTLYVLRFLLGVAEAGFFPGIILYLTYWFPAARRGKITALFMMAVPLSAFIGNPLSGWIMHTFNNVSGFSGWQWVFLLEALPAIVLGFVILARLDDRIADASWLTEDEKNLLKYNVEAEEAKKEKLSLVKILKRPRVWSMTLIYFSLSMGLYGVSFWMPTIMRNSGVKDNLTVGLLTAIPPFFAIIAMVLNSGHSDRSGERRWHVALPAFIGSVGLAASAFNSDSTFFALTALIVANVGIQMAVPVFWSLPTAFLGGAAAAAGIALINSIGNLSGFVSPYLVGWLKDVTGSTNIGIYILALFLIVGGLAAVAQPKAITNR